jgi:UTP--glucose-1-phosphate uridylyltransferase
LPYYGTIGGRRLAGHRDLYEVETVIEKPTPTEAELGLIVPGFRAGYYLCFFGMHVLTPTIFEILEQHVLDASREAKVSLSGGLAELARREKYLALEEQARRYDVGVRYGLLIAQLALVLSGEDRDEVLTRILELLAHREQSASGR